MSKENDKRIKELRERIGSLASSDPKQSAKELREAIAFCGTMLKMAGLPGKEMSVILDDLMEEHFMVFKAKVEEELLQSQKATDEALSAALGMRGQK